MVQLNKVMLLGKLDKFKKTIQEGKECFVGVINTFKEDSRNPRQKITESNRFRAFGDNALKLEDAKEGMLIYIEGPVRSKKTDNGYLSEVLANIVEVYPDNVIEGTVETKGLLRPQ